MSFGSIGAESSFSAPRAQVSGERVEYWLGESIGVWDREANTLSTALNVYDYVNPWDDWVDAPNSYTTSHYFCSAKRTEVAARSTGRCRGRRG